MKVITKIVYPKLNICDIIEEEIIDGADDSAPEMTDENLNADDWEIVNEEVSKLHKKTF